MFKSGLKSGKVVASVVMGLMVVVLIAGLAFVGLGQSSANAASLAQTSTGTSAITTPTAAAGTSASTTKGNGTAAQLRTAFQQAFAADLGVDQSKLNSAYTSAVDQTVDQAVKDGKLTQAQGDKIKKAAANGFKGGIAGNAHAKGTKTGAKVATAKKSLVDAASKALGISTTELTTDLKAGQSIADIAKAKNLDIATVKTSILASIKTDLDTAVSKGKLTQDKADKAYQTASTNIDKLVNRTFKGTAGGHTHGKKHTGTTTAPTATPGN